MTSAVDTNVVVALLAGTEVETATAQKALVDAATKGPWLSARPSMLS